MTPTPARLVELRHLAYRSYVDGCGKPDVRLVRLLVEAERAHTAKFRKETK